MPNAYNTIKTKRKSTTYAKYNGVSCPKPKSECKHPLNVDVSRIDKRKLICFSCYYTDFKENFKWEKKNG